MESNKITRLHAVENRTFDFDPSVPCILSEGHGFMTSPEFRTFMERGLELIREKIAETGKLGWLVDTRFVEVFEAQDTAWVVEYWNIKAYEAGLRYIAFVMPESVFAEMNINEYIDLSKEADRLVLNHFKDQESAKAWLRGVVGVIRQ
jgi:hypothetical protein